MVGQVEVEVETRQVAFGLLLRLVDERLREDHPARFVMRMRQRQEARRPGVLVPDLVRRHGCELVPRHVGGQLDAHAVLHRLPARHRDALGRAVREVVACGEQILLPLGERGLLLLRALYHGSQGFRLHERIVLTGNGDRSPDERGGAHRARGHQPPTERQVVHGIADSGLHGSLQIHLRLRVCEMTRWRLKGGDT